MRVAIVCFPVKDPKPLAAIADAMAKALEGQGHRPEILAADADPARLASYDFVFLGAETSGIKGAIPPRVREFLKQSYGLAGKRCHAFLRKSGLRPGKALDRLMATMESEGMRLTSSDIVAGPEDAAVVARNASVERS
jgi:hypothetical protein